MMETQTAPAANPLLDAARKVRGPVASLNLSDDAVGVLIAWARGEITEKQATAILATEMNITTTGPRQKFAYMLVSLIRRRRVEVKQS